MKKGLKQIVSILLCLVMLLTNVQITYADVEEVGSTVTISLKDFLDSTIIDFRYKHKYKIKKSDFKEFFDKKFFNYSYAENIKCEDSKDGVNGYLPKDYVDKNADKYYFRFIDSDDSIKYIFGEPCQDDMDYLLFDFSDVKAIFMSNLNTEQTSATVHNYSDYYYSDFYRYARDTIGIELPHGYDLENKTNWVNKKQDVDYGNESAFLDTLKTKIVGYKSLNKNDIIDKNTAFICTYFDGKDINGDDIKDSYLKENKDVLIRLIDENNNVIENKGCSIKPIGKTVHKSSGYNFPYLLISFDDSFEQYKFISVDTKNDKKYKKIYLTFQVNTKATTEHTVHTFEFSEPTFEWSDLLDKCIAKFKCAYCDETLDVPCKINVDVQSNLSETSCILGYKRTTATVPEEYKGVDLLNSYSSSYKDTKEKNFSELDNVVGHTFKSEWVKIKDKTEDLFNHAENKDELDKDLYNNSDSIVLKQYCSVCKDAYKLYVVKKNTPCKVSYYDKYNTLLGVTEINQGDCVVPDSSMIFKSSFESDATDISFSIFSSYSDKAVVNKDTKQATRVAIGSDMSVELENKNTIYTVILRGRATTESNAPSLQSILGSRYYFGDNASITDEVIKNNANIKNFNFGYEYYLDSDALDSNIRYCYSEDSQIFFDLTPAIIMTYKDVDTFDIIKQEKYKVGEGILRESDFDDPAFDNYYPYLLYTNERDYNPANKPNKDWYWYAPNDRHNLKYDNTAYLLKKERCYKIQISVKDDEGNSLSDDFSFFNTTNCFGNSDRLLPNFFSYTYNEKTDTFDSELLPVDGNTGYRFDQIIIRMYNGHNSERCAVGGSTSGEYMTESINVRFNDTLDDVVSVNHSSGLLYDALDINYSFDKQTHLLKINLSVKKYKVTVLHNYYDENNVLLDTKTETFKWFPLNYCNVYALRKPNYKLKDSSSKTFNYLTKNEDATFNYVKDSSLNEKNSIVINTESSDGMYNTRNEQSNVIKSVLYNDTKEYKTFDKNIEDGIYKIKCWVEDEESNTSLDVATVTVQDGHFTVKPIENKGYKIESYSTDDDLLDITINQIPYRIYIRDYYWGKWHTRLKNNYYYGYKINNKDNVKRNFIEKIRSYRTWAVDSPTDEEIPDTVTSDIYFDYYYDNKGASTSTVKLTVLDENNNKVKNLNISVGNHNMLEKRNNTYAWYSVEDGNNDIKIGDTKVGNVFVNHVSDNYDNFALAANCNTYELVSSGKTRGQEYSITLKQATPTAVKKKVTVVDKYDDTGHVREEKEYEVGDTYTYQALNKDGYTVDKEEQTGTVTDDVTIYFIYTKINNNNNQPTTPTEPSTPTQPTEPTQPTQPSEPTPPSEPSTEPSTEPNEPDTEPTKPQKVEKIKIKVYDKYDGKKHLRKEIEVKKSDKEIVLKALNKAGYTANKKTITVKSNKNQDVVFEYTKNKPKPDTKNEPKPETPVQEDIKSPKTYDNRGMYGVIWLVLLIGMGITFVLGKKKEE